MDDKETLIRVEQQLQDSMKNQSMILSDLKDIFNKIETESRVTSVVKSDLKSHLEMSKIKKEEEDRRFRSIDEKIIELSSEFNDFQENVSDERRKRYDEINTIKTDTSTFQKQVMTSISLLKWIIGVSLLIVSVLWPMIMFILQTKK